MSERVRHSIRSLAPRVTREQATAAFERGMWRKIRGQRLRSVAAAYLPFRLFEVEVVNRGKSSTPIFACDAMTGTLDLYEFERPPPAGELVEVVTSNVPAPRLDAARALEVIEEKVRRAVFQAGFFRVRNLQVRARRLEADVHIPYWLGFFGDGADARLRVMDAVRRQMEGAKARALFEDWLLGRLDGVIDVGVQRFARRSAGDP